MSKSKRVRRAGIAPTQVKRSIPEWDGLPESNGKEEMSVDVMEINKKTAEQWLKKNHDANRVISPGTVASLAQDMRSGNWKVTHQGICFDGEGRLIDGQHRLQAVVESGVTVKMLVCRNQNAELMDPIDRTRVRSIGMIVGIRNQWVSACKMLKFLEAGSIANRTNRQTVSETLEVYNHHEAMFQKTEGHPRKQLFGGTIAALIWAMPINEGVTLEFWDKLSRGDMIGPGNPVYSLRNWFLRGAGANRPEDMCFATLNAFRHYFHGKKMTAVFTGESGYRAITTQRRVMNIPHTPGPDLVPTMQFKPTNADQDDSVPTREFT